MPREVLDTASGMPDPDELRVDSLLQDIRRRRDEADAFLQRARAEEEHARTLRDSASRELQQAEHARSTFRKAVMKWPEVQTCLQLSGEWDYSMKVVAPDLDAYAIFLMEKVLALPVVVNVQSSFVLETVKDTTALPV